MEHTTPKIQDIPVPVDADHTKCKWSSGIHDCLTVGRGELDAHGFWEQGCPTCARQHEIDHPEDGPVWPHKSIDVERMFPEDTDTQTPEEKG